MPLDSLYLSLRIFSETCFRLLVFTAVSPGFAGAADTGPGLALALWVVLFNTASAVTAFNVTGFTLYHFVPYFDVLEGGQSLPAYMTVVAAVSLYHLIPVLVMACSMYFSIGIGGSSLLFPVYLAGISLWTLEVFGFIALVMGLESFLYSVFTDRIFHLGGKAGLQKFQHPVSRRLEPKRTRRCTNCAVLEKPKRKHSLSLVERIHYCWDETASC